MESNVTRLRPTRSKPAPAPKAAPVRSKSWQRKVRRQAIAAYGIGAVALVLMGLSLSHLAAGVHALTHGDLWHAMFERADDAEAFATLLRELDIPYQWTER